MTEPKTEREWLAELRNAASTDPVEPWLLHVVDGRLAELGRTTERTPLASEPPVGSVVAAAGSVFIRGQDDANGPVWRRAGHRSAYGWGNILAIGEAVLLRFGNDPAASAAPPRASRPVCGQPTRTEGERCNRTAGHLGACYLEEPQTLAVMTRDLIARCAGGAMLHRDAEQLVADFATAVRAESVASALNAAAEALYSDDGPGNLLSTATWLRARAARSHA